MTTGKRKAKGGGKDDPVDGLGVPRPSSVFARRLFWLGVYVVVLSYVVEILVRGMYCDHGHGDQLPVFYVVFVSFVLPVSAPIFIIKDVLFAYVLPFEVEEYIVNEGGRLLLTPSTPFDDKSLEEELITDYSDVKYWSALPGRRDSGETHPPNADHCSVHDLCDVADVFYLHPTTWYTSLSWNAPALHPVTQYLSDDAILPQQGTAFNVAARVFAPRYRQACAAAYLQKKKLEDENAKKAFQVAYNDVKAAFQHYLDHYNDGRPIILAGHSQGALLSERLVHDFFQGKPLQEQLVAAYLVGTTVFKEKYDRAKGTKHGVHACEHPEDVGCVISWRTFGFGGNPKMFLHVEPDPSHDRPICTNPLSWTENDGRYIDHGKNLGGVDLMHPWTMWEYLRGIARSSHRIVVPELTPNMSDAQCLDGHLYVTKPSGFGYGWWVFPAWTFAMFPGINLHSYDFNLFYNNVRNNTVQRVRAFLQRKN